MIWRQVAKHALWAFFGACCIGGAAYAQTAKQPSDDGILVFKLGEGLWPCFPNEYRYGERKVRMLSISGSLSVVIAEDGQKSDFNGDAYIQDCQLFYDAYQLSEDTFLESQISRLSLPQFAILTAHPDLTGELFLVISSYAVDEQHYVLAAVMLSTAIEAYSTIKFECHKMHWQVATLNNNCDRSKFELAIQKLIQPLESATKQSAKEGQIGQGAEEYFRDIIQTHKSLSDKH